MNADKKSAVHQLFVKNYPEKVSQQVIESLMKDYPYMAHFHWVNAFSNRENKAAMEHAALYAFYPLLLQRSIENGALFQNKQQEDHLHAKEITETEEKLKEERSAKNEDEGKEFPTSNILQGNLSVPEEEENVEKSKENVVDTSSKEEEEEKKDEKVTTSKKNIETEESAEKEDNQTPISAIQPLYTEDYFAYTQTKLPEEIENDKPPTMEQVNSFTGWLKKMKRPQAMPEEEKLKDEDTVVKEEGREEGDTEKEMNNEEEEDVNLKDNEVITESMAEIWVQYGDFNKAEEVYRKLILLNPEKKTYFAKKIKAFKAQ